MEARRQKLERTKKRERSVLEDMDSVNRKLNNVELAHRKHKTRVRQIESEIKTVEGSIAVNAGNIQKGKIWIKRKLRAMHKYGQAGDLYLLLAASDDITGLMRRWKYLESLARHEKKTIQGYSENITQLEQKEKQLTTLKAELKKEEDRLRTAEDSLLDNRREKAALLASIKKEKSENEKLLRELQESSKRLLETIRRLEEKDTYEAKGFSALKGKLLWPVNGKVAIPYGSQKDPRFNTPVFRNGIYIKTEDNSPVRAVYGGKVVFADWFKGYGNLMIINHGEGHHTLYANLSEIFLKVGDIIKISDLIGKVGESGILNAPSLYFEIRYKGRPLDPAQWLKKK